MSLQPIYNIADICGRHGLEQAILSPGSRCAPISLGFTRHPDIICRTISDERSAAFIALGISQRLKKPSVLVCTSGSAAYNYAPAVAEAFFQQVPLIIITADRPPELIDQLDGQTIRQTNIYGNHVKKSYTLPVDHEHPDAAWHTARVISEGINLSQEYPRGPVHINVPLREPLYNDHEITFDKEVKIITATPASAALTDGTWDELIDQWKAFKRILIVGGQDVINKKLEAALENLIKEHKIPIVGDIISNLHPVQDVIKHADIFIGQDKNGLKESLQPNLLVTFGKSIISKNLKQLLRNYKPTAHWHIQPAGYSADTYMSLTKIIQADSDTFFTKLAQIELAPSFDNQKQENFYHIWQIEERKTLRQLQKFFPQQPLGEFELIYEIINKLPDHCNLHLANSMAVRYANFVGLNNPTIEVFANRGTSGIDGSSSTAVGHCLGSEKLNVLITGDLAFFYDRNAFWHNYDMKNLRIVLLNNHAGGIFRIINGPNKLPELEEYFETKQTLNGRLTAEEFGFDYLKCDKRSKLNNFIKEFFDIGTSPKILELESVSEDNAAILRGFKEMVKDT
ncbi:MAG: 2-succinyl-5-enolpyruvyl-6-hydroxy-3-cyclohexene-1-carboxylic-acid synthase [Fulvivirga sp.]